MVLIIIPTITIKIRTGIRMTVCDNSRTYVPDVRSGTPLFSITQVPRRYAELLLSAYLHFAGTT